MDNIKHRKVIQISLGLHQGGALAALCDDGSMWIKDCPWDARDNWIRVVNVPAIRILQTATAPASEREGE